MERRGVLAWTVGLVVVVLGLFLTFFLVLPERMVPPAGMTKVERLQAESNVRTTGVQALGGMVLLVGAAIGAYYTGRQVQISPDGQVTERFTRAVDQLGSEKPEVRLGGIYALERLAHESRVDHGPIVEVLLAFLIALCPS